MYLVLRVVIVAGSNLRVHISPVGYDPVQRVTDALTRFRADRTYLVTYRKDDSAAKQFRKVKEALKQQGADNQLK